MDEFEIQECIVSVIPSPKDSYDLPLESHVLGHQSFFFFTLEFTGCYNPSHRLAWN
jgi:hypothetical protein